LSSAGLLKRHVLLAQTGKNEVLGHWGTAGWPPAGVRRKDRLDAALTAASISEQNSWNHGHR